MVNEHETLRDNIDFLRESTMRLGRIRDELDEESELYGRLEGQICILDAVLDELERLYDDAFKQLR
jgi:hypothetical protein